MTPPVRPEPDDPVAAYKREYLSSHPDTSGDPVAEYKAQYMPKQKGVLSRAGDQIAGLFQSLVHNPVGTVASVAGAPIKSGFDAAIAPEVGERRPDPRLSKGGNSSMLGNKDPMPDLGSYDAEHGAVTGKQRAVATGQTFANILFPEIAGKAAGGFAKLGASRAVANVGGLATAGGAAGAAYSPDDPLAGAVSGAALTPVIAGVAKGAGKTIGKAASSLKDFTGRPAQTQPLIKAGPLEMGEVEGVADRAARENAAGLERRGITADQLEALATASDKPLAAIDLAGTAGQRMARGLKTSSPPAEAALRDVLQPRAEGAVERVIEHGLETTGLVNRANGLQTVDDLIAQRAQHGNENFPKTFKKYPKPLDDPEFSKLASTPAGKLALQRGQIIAANRGENIGEIADISVPPEGVSPEAWANVQRLAKERGLPVPENPNAPKHIAPTLQQAHFVKLGFDDMLASPPEPGSGGSGPVNTAAIRELKNRWLRAMDKNAPEYAKDRKTFADDSDLIRAAETGRNLWKMHPDEAAKVFREMSAAEQDVARRTGFDALAERIENGPADVSKGASKPRDVKRMRLLFPEGDAGDAAFAKFQKGIREEAQMMASGRAVLEGSNTADKIADMADMAGVVIPDLFRAARGNPGPLLARSAKAILADRFRANADALNVERVRQLSAGANGDAAARTEALGRIAKAGKKRAANGPGTFSALLAPRTTRPGDRDPGRSTP